MRRITDTERRARLATRHHLAPSAKAADAVALADRMVGLHATDPATVFLAAAARLRRPTVGALERALYDDRTLVRTLCMRRTLFVVPVDLVPIVQAAVTDALVPAERKRTVRMIEEAGIARAGRRWLRRAEGETLAAVEAAGEITGADLSKAVPRLRQQIPYGEGKSWAGKMGMTTRVLFLLACEQRVVRGRPQGAWTSTRYRWAPMRSWLPDVFAVWTPDEARADLARRWLAAFAPARWPTSSGGRAGRSAGPARRWSPSTPSTSSSRTVAPRWCSLATRRRCARRSRGRRCCRASTRRRWAGPSVTGISGRTRRRCSTGPVMRARRSGGTAASWGAGPSARTARSCGACSTTSASTGDGRSSGKPSASGRGSTGRWWSLASRRPSTSSSGVDAHVCLDRHITD